ncbi:MAG: hypothetical protein RLZZ176_1649 [Cyanobacteriota bacterium]|jgi:hypothetical protein
MKSFRFSPGKSKHNKFFRLATSAIAALAICSKTHPESRIPTPPPLPNPVVPKPESTNHNTQNVSLS